MGTISELIGLLEKIPAWKRLRELPDKIDALENRIKILEAKLSRNGDKCPKCGEYSFMVESSHPHPEFGEVGIIERIYVCDHCHYSEAKLIE